MTKNRNNPNVNYVRKSYQNLQKVVKINKRWSNNKSIITKHAQCNFQVYNASKFRKYLNQLANNITRQMVNRFNPLLHRYSFLRLLQQTTFENIVTKEEIAPAEAISISSFATTFSKFSNLKTVHFFQQSEHPRFI